jgi:radical SAM superfamily enzyme YgiQ (UPF0313 family)
MKKLLLINPVGRRSGFLLSRFSTFPPLGLAYVAAVTPLGWNIKLIDENFEKFEYEEADLVGITAFTSNINRAYEISRIYRERNVRVVLGGIHASMHPEEASEYADVVLVGEAEGIWEKVIHDFENNRLAARYDGPQVDLSRFQITPRRDLFHSNYLWQPVQTSRGCPFDCNFCSVSKHLGKDYRQRSAREVLDELESIPGKYIAFVDDNLIGYSASAKARAVDLFRGMIDRKLQKKWWMQTSINAADDEHVIKLAAQAGCVFAFVGFETTSEDILKEMKKGVNLKIGVENYQKVVETFHKYGIGVLGSFIIGNDYESPIYYKKLANFLVRSKIDIFQISILTPLPGTKLMTQLQKENRLIYKNFPKDWEKYRLSYMVHKVAGTDATTIYWGNNYIKKRLYSFPWYQIRLLRSLFKLKILRNFFAVYKLNEAFKRSWLNSHYSNNKLSYCDQIPESFEKVENYAK